MSLVLSEETSRRLRHAADLRNQGVDELVETAADAAALGWAIKNEID